MLPEVGFEVSVRAMSEAALDRLEGAVRRIVAAEAAASGYQREPDVIRKAASRVTVSDPETMRRVSAAQRAALGDHAVIGWVPAMATEDVDCLAAAGADLHGCSSTRLVYWMLGGVTAADWAGAPGDTGDKLAAQQPNHSPQYAPDADAAIPAGIAALTSAVRALAPPD